MYYEEKIIDGILHYRNNPFDAWKSKTSIELTEMLHRAREENRDLRIKLNYQENCGKAIAMLKEAFKEVQ